MSIDPRESAAPADPAIPTLPVICDQCRAKGVAGDPQFEGIPEILNFEPVPRKARSNGWKPEHQRAFIAALALTGSPYQAARAIGKHPFGAETLRKARGGRPFAHAWDAALDIAREREMERLRENLSELATDTENALARIDPENHGDDGRGRGGGGDMLDIEAYEAVQAAIRDKLLRARRMFLFEASLEADTRAAWELLVGWADWEKARRLEPQDNEPYGIPNLTKRDMLLAGDAGYLGEVAGGRDKMREFDEAMEEMRTTGRNNGPAANRLLGEEPPSRSE